MANSISVRLRKAKASDIAAITALELASFHDTGQAFSRRQVGYLVRRAKGMVLVAAAGEKIAGWIVALWREQAGHRSGRVYTVAVDPAMQGMGIGRRLVETALKGLQKEGATSVFLEVAEKNHGAIALYHKLGFVSLGKLDHYYARHQHAWRMRRELT